MLPPSVMPTLDGQIPNECCEMGVSLPLPIFEPSETVVAAGCGSRYRSHQGTRDLITRIGILITTQRMLLKTMPGRSARSPKRR